MALLSNLVRQSRPESRDVFKEYLVQQGRDRVEIRCESVGSDAQRFKRDGTAASKRIDNKRSRARNAAKCFVCCLYQCAACLNEISVG